MNGVFVLGIELWLLVDEVHYATFVAVVHLFVIIIAVEFAAGLVCVEDDAIDAGPPKQVFHVCKVAPQLQSEAFR